MTSISQARAMGIWQAIAAGLLLLLQLLIASASPDLQNPDLEIPPTNSTYPFPALDSTIKYLPQWFSQGDVSYVFTSSHGNYRYLGKNGKITQEFKANVESSHYLLTFSLQPARTNCDNTTSVTISVPVRSVVVSFSNKFAGGNQSSHWQTHGVYLGIHGNGELVTLSLECSNTTTAFTDCGVRLEDSFILKNIPNPINSSVRYGGLVNNLQNNMLPNGGFEYGPAFPNNSVGGVLIDAESDATQSPLNQWEILGTVKYITTNHNYTAPEGKASIELIAGKSSGIQTSVKLKKGSEYALSVFIGEHNDACVGDFQVGVQAGSSVQNFTIQIKGAGTGLDSGWKIKSDSNRVTRISILSLATTKSKDGVLCGPVIDKVVLLASYGLKLQISILFVGIGFLATLVQITG
ncbi:hypothetical protein C5167_000524 [Papaver somniferum]|uniref:DUF642 domain-containing protein n=1 Tax=Papaver somniferum TaxID=3469 RepID=A0A4Y7KV04_PAPSO|nr:uncharacterized protein LOC113307709 [Papaver somniferum]RZC75759.1 hypothetical protein C5167_000524 [Papaver somniferum]